ncbi:uncharacterized protein LOC105426656 [Pogonomyrmex barbatus]|uniref:Uncharacterized protein LOC105426656 n=1 Tax=Pogonomyrmex barbatus TaxID=144034 RepID=A0A6I9W4I7_9HYME|nr:uncharacterized protein LOC105426656 [Pogonomyrmex barbatus]XP_011636272.1 uncharacterized protein LOC105426656 [Pogonomyrmex barbatus]
MTFHISRSLTVAVSCFAILINCSPKFDDGGFVPSSISYMEKQAKAQDQVAMPSSQIKQNDETSKRDSEVNDISDRGQEARFGFTNIGGTGSGYGVSPYAPAKIDLGGLLLGAIIGVGSILIIPKLLYILGGTYGAYARSEDNGFTQTLTRIDDILARHGIDTTSCMQRAVCTYSQQAASAMGDENANEKDERATSFDRMVNAITTNQVFRTAMQGTAIEEAVEAGRSGRSCSRSYPHCGFSMETMLSLLANVIAMTNARAAMPTGSSSL